MCSADTTIETIPDKDAITDGWGYQHQCRDFGEISLWASKHRIKRNATELEMGGRSGAA